MFGQVRRMLTSITVGMVTLAAAPFAAADSWTIKGRVKVEVQLPEVEAWCRLQCGEIWHTASFRHEWPLVGVEVKVSGRPKVLGGYTFSVWGNWGTDVTDADGDFSVSETENSPRQIRVQVRFDGDDLVIHDGNGLDDSSKWHTIYQAERTSGTIDLGDLVFKASASQDLDDPDARQQAELWVLGGALLETMDDLGHPFQDRLVITQGYANWLGDDLSYCDPFTHWVHLEEDDFDAYTVIHECMHAWMYEHMSGEIDLVTKLPQTHCLQSDGDSWVAFVEGFSHYCEGPLGEIMFGADPKLPFNRESLNDGLVNWDDAWEDCGDRLTSIDRMERHCAGWASLFRLVTTPGIARYDFNDGSAGNAVTFRYSGPFGSAGAYYDPYHDFDDVLDAIGANLAKGDMNFVDFLHKMVDANLNYPRTVLGTTNELWLRLLDPAEDVQPWELFEWYEISTFP